MTTYLGCTIRRVAEMDNWKDRMAGWAHWVVKYPNGTIERVIGTEYDAQAYIALRLSESPEVTNDRIERANAAEAERKGY